MKTIIITCSLLLLFACRNNVEPDIIHGEAFNKVILNFQPPYPVEFNNAAGIVSNEYFKPGRIIVRYDRDELTKPNAYMHPTHVYEGWIKFDGSVNSRNYTMFVVIW